MPQSTSDSPPIRKEAKLRGGLFDLPIVHGLYELYKAFHLLLLKFPKSQRYSLGSTIQTELLAVVEIIVTAAAATDTSAKKRCLQAASTKIDLLRLLVRLAKDCKCFNNKSYLALESQLHEIGRMLGGWLKSL